MIESKDYIMVQIRQMMNLIAKLLSLSLIDDKNEIKETVAECLRIAGLNIGDLPADAASFDKIHDEQVLGYLSQALSVYLAVEKDEKAARFYELISERLKNSTYMVIDYINPETGISTETNTTKH